MAADLEIRIGAELTEIKGALAGLQRDLRATGESAKSLGSIEGSINGAVGAVKMLIAGFAALTSVQVFKTIAAQGVEFNKVMEDTRLGIASIVTSIAKLRDEQGDIAEGPKALQIALGLAEQQLFKLRIAGLETAATTRELAVAFQSAVGPGIAAGLSLDQIRTLTVQITQAATALGVPTYQLAQEIRSILSGEIDINSRVAKTLGLSNEQVKNWQTQGKLVAELNNRLAGFTEAGKIAANNFSVVTSNAREAVDSLAGDIFSGFTEQLKKGIQDATQGLFNTQDLKIDDSLAAAADMARMLATDIGKGLGDSLRFVVDLAREFSKYLQENEDSANGLWGSFKLLLGQISGAVSFVAKLVLFFADLVVKSTIFQKVMETVAVLIGGAQDGFRVIGAIITGLGTAIFSAIVLPIQLLLRGAAKITEAFSPEKADAMRGFADALDEIKQSGYDTAASLIKPVADGTGAVASAIAQMGQYKRASEEAAKSKAKALSADPAGSTDGLKNPIKLPGADLNALAKAQAERDIQLLEQRYKDNLISTQDYYKQRISLQLQAVEAEIRVERDKQERLKKEDENGQRDAATRIALLNQKKTALIQDGGRDQELAIRDLNDRITDLAIRELENRGQLEAAASLRTQKEYRDLIARLKADGKTEAAQIVENLIDTEKARQKFAEIKAEFDRIQAALTGELTAAQQQVALGQITSAQGAAQESAARALAIEQVTVLNGKLQELAARTNDPAIKQGAADIANSLKQMGIDGATGIEQAMIQLRVSLDELQKSFASNAINAGVSALTNFFADIATGSKSAGEALRDFVRGFVASMAQIAARALATYAVLQLVSIATGIPVQALGATLGIGASRQHSGGMAGTGPKMNVNPLLFVGAPRYHNGGMVGLKPDERPAILQTGEEVLSRTDPRNAANGGAEGGNGYRIVNVLDPALVSNYLESSSGERTVMNIIGRNPSQVRQLLGG